MTIAELQKQKVEIGKHVFHLKTPSGIEFLTHHDDIRHPGNTVDLSQCEVIGEGMNHGEAQAWAAAHPLSKEMLEKLKVELAKKT